jgi:hypothetical protein
MTLPHASVGGVFHYDLWSSATSPEERFVAVMELFANGRNVEIG